MVHQVVQQIVEILRGGRRTFLQQPIGEGREGLRAGGLLDRDQHPPGEHHAHLVAHQIHRVDGEAQPMQHQGDHLPQGIQPRRLRGVEHHRHEHLGYPTGLEHRGDAVGLPESTDANPQGGSPLDQGEQLLQAELAVQHAGLRLQHHRREGGLGASFRQVETRGHLPGSVLQPAGVQASRSRPQLRQALHATHPRTPTLGSGLRSDHVCSPTSTRCCR